MRPVEAWKGSLIVRLVINVVEHVRWHASCHVDRCSGIEEFVGKTGVSRPLDDLPFKSSCLLHLSCTELESAQLEYLWLALLLWRQFFARKGGLSVSSSMEAHGNMLPWHFAAAFSLVGLAASIYNPRFITFIIHHTSNWSPHYQSSLGPVSIYSYLIATTCFCYKALSITSCMMEGLAAAANVAGVLNLGLVVCQELLSYYGSWKGAADDVNRMYASIEALAKTLLCLKRTYQKEHLDAEVVERVKECIKACESGMSSLQKKLDKIKNITQANLKRMDKMKAHFQRTLYPFKESTLAKLKEICNDLRSDLDLALNTLQM